MNRKLILGVVCLLLGATAVQAQQVNEAQVRQRISQVASKMKTMQCDFVQTKYVKMLNDKMVSKGKMYYRQPNKLRWEYTSPYAYTFLLNDSKVQMKSSQRSSVVDVKQNKLFGEIARVMMNSVVGKCLSDEKDFRVSMAESRGEWIATLLPVRKEMKQMFQKIILHFDKSQSMVSEVDLLEKNGDKTVISLRGVKVNQAIDDDCWVLEK